MGARRHQTGIIKETKRGKPKDNLTLDAMDAEDAGLSYGKFKAMHPNTAFMNESRLAGKSTENQREVVRAQYVKICPTCGKEFTCHNRSRVYCDDNCKDKGGAKWQNPSTKKKEA